MFILFIAPSASFSAMFTGFKTWSSFWSSCSRNSSISSPFWIQILCRTHAAWIESQILITDLLLMCFSLRNLPFKSPKALSITCRFDARHLLKYFCCLVRRPVSLYGVINQTFKGYAASPNKWFCPKRHFWYPSVQMLEFLRTLASWTRPGHPMLVCMNC